MVKQGLINFFKNLKYCFTSLGTLFLGVLFGVCFLFSGFKTQVSKAVSDVKTITSEANINFDDFKNCIIESFSEISWKDPVEATKTVTSSEWINGTLKKNLEDTIENYKFYAEDIELALQSACTGYVKYVVAFALCIALGLFGGFFLTRYLIRQGISKTRLLQFVLVTLLDSVFTVGVVALCLWLTFLWKPSIILISIFGIILYGFISLVEAYLIRGAKQVPFKKVVNLKNVILSFVTDLVIYLIVLLISALGLVITNAFVGIFVALPLFIIGINVISLNSESYVISLKQKKSEK